jgi:hypothetical protein
MDKKYNILLTQLIQGYHLEESELIDLELYLKAQLTQIQLIKKRYE